MATTILTPVSIDSIIDMICFVNQPRSVATTLYLRLEMVSRWLFTMARPPFLLWPDPFNLWLYGSIFAHNAWSFWKMEIYLYTPFGTVSDGGKVVFMFYDKWCIRVIDRKCHPLKENVYLGYLTICFWKYLSTYFPSFSHFLLFLAMR